MVLYSFLRVQLPFVKQMVFCAILWILDTEPSHSVLMRVVNALCELFSSNFAWAPATDELGLLPAGI